MRGAAAATAVQVDPPRLPRLQKVRLRSWASSATKVKTPVTAPATALTAIPASSMVETDTLPWTRASR